MKHGADGMNVHAPTFKNEVSWNSVGILVSIVLAIGGLVYTVGEVRSSLQSQLEAHAESIAEIRADMRRIDEQSRRFESLEFRVAANERRSDSMRTVEQTVIGLSSDMRLVMEILGRLERGQNGSQPPLRGTVQ